MQIGEVATESGVNAQTIRFYERRGLLRKPARTRSGYRDYSAGVVGVVRFIKQTQELGFTLAEIKQLLALRENKGGNAEKVRALTTAKIETVNERIRNLETIRDELQTVLAACQCGSAELPDCPVIE